MLLFPQGGFAQVENTVPTQIATNELQPGAKIFLGALKIEKDAYKSGETIRGSFQLVNPDKSYISDVYYAIALVGKFDKNNLPQTTYTQKVVGPYSFASSEVKYFDFEHTIPTNLSGDIGIQVVTFLRGGNILGIDTKKITSTGEMSYIFAEGAALFINEKRFHPQEGPTVRENDKVEFRVQLKNPSNKKIEAAPHIAFFTRWPVPPVLKTVKERTLVFAPNELKEVRFEVPIFEAPAPYVGELVLLDDTNQLVGGTTMFRYIRHGEALSIASLSADKTIVQKGETFNVSVVVNPPLFDIEQNTEPKIGTVTLTVEVYNEKDELVGKGSSTFDANNITTNTKNFSLIAERSANILNVKANIVQGDKVLAKSETNLTSLSGIPPPPQKPSLLLVLLPSSKIVLILLIILLVLCMFIFRKHISRKIFFLLLGVTILLLGLFVTQISSAQYWWTDPSCYTQSSPQLANIETQIQQLQQLEAQQYDPGYAWVWGGETAWRQYVANQLKSLKTERNGILIDLLKRFNLTELPLTICDGDGFTSSGATIYNQNATLSWKVAPEKRIVTTPAEICIQGLWCFSLGPPTETLEELPTTCTLSGGSHSNTPVTPSGSLSVPVADEGTNYTLTCRNSTRTVSKTITTIIYGVSSSGGNAFASPMGPGILRPGQSYCVSGSIGKMACANTNGSGSWTITPPYGSSVSSGYSANSGCSGSWCHKIDNWIPGTPPPSACFTAPNSDGFYNATLSVSGALSGSGTWTFRVKAPRPTIGSFSASPTTIPRGGSSTLSWSSAGASYCTISGIGNVGASGSKPVFPTQDTTYTITCYSASGTPSDPVSRTIQVVYIGSFSATPPIITPGEYVSFSWSSNANSCSLSPVGSVPTNANGYRTYPTTDMTYTLTCTRNEISLSSSPFTVKILRIGSFSGGPTTVLSGGAVKFSWSTTNAQSCTLSPLGSVPVNATNYTVHPTTDTTYTLTCKNGSASITSSPIAIRILDIPFFDVSPKKINRGQSAILTWITKNAISCTASSNPIDSGWSGSKQVGNDSQGQGSQRSQTITPPPLPAGSTPRNYSLTCTGPGGTPSLTKPLAAPGLKVHTLLTKIECSKDNIIFGDCANIKLVAGSSVYLKDLSDPTPGSTISNRVWTFSNGSPAQCPSSHAGCTNIKVPRVSFLKEGDQTTTLIVTDSAGETETITKTFKVGKPSFQETTPQ